MAFNIYITTKTIGQKIIHFNEIDSSNNYLLNNYHGDYIDGLVVIADHQTDGRGRLKREWLSKPNQSLLFSIMLLPDLDPKIFHQITFLGALAVAKALEQVCKLNPMIKWPNDVYLNNRKTCGILSETKVFQDRASAKESLGVIVGIGLNLNQRLEDFPDELKSKATSVYIETGKEWDRTLILPQILRQFEWAYELWKSQSFSTILEEIAMRFYLKDRKVELRNSLSNTIYGRVIGLSSQGFLLIQDANDKVHTVLSGDVYAFDH